MLPNILRQSLRHRLKYQTTIIVELEGSLIPIEEVHNGVQSYDQSNSCHKPHVDENIKLPFNLLLVRSSLTTLDLLSMMDTT
jgi:hypothetical protein